MSTDAEKQAAWDAYNKAVDAAHEAYDIYIKAHGAALRAQLALRDADTCEMAAYAAYLVSIGRTK